ncbi:MAG: kelch repeat-containing protein, partial [Acidobacteriaceae bacterium]
MHLLPRFPPFVSRPFGAPSSPTLRFIALLLLGLATAASSAAQTWVQLNPIASPPARSAAGMVYDAAHGQILLFGGFTFSGYLNDTWIWDGSIWTQAAPANSPSPRGWPAMAYDAAHHQVVLFGGYSADSTAGVSGWLGDTWIWSGANWTQQNPATSPSGRTSSAAVYDPIRHNVVLFGGQDSGDNFLNDTWLWDGSNWSQAAPASRPPGRGDAAMAFDGSTGQAVLFGGRNNFPFVYFTDTWTWDGTNWSQATPATHPPAGFTIPSAWDPDVGQVVLYGPDSLDGTWAWDGSNWLELTPAITPGSRFSPSLTFDAETGTLVLFGGGGSDGGLFNDTWTLQLGATHLVVSAPASAKAGTPFDLTVTAEDAAGNPVTGYAGEVTFASTDAAAVLPTNTTLTGGEGVFPVTLNTPGGQIVTAADTETPSIAGISDSIQVRSQAAFTLKTDPSSQTIRRGTLAVFLLEARSANGFAGTLRLTCSGGPPKSLCDDFPPTLRLKAGGADLALSGILVPVTTAPGVYTVTFTGVSG